AFNRADVTPWLALIDDHNPRCFAQDVARLVFTDATAYALVFGLEAVLFLAAAWFATLILQSPRPSPQLQPGE
ncbi:MAG: hypothetical protein AAFR02_12305, partial [Pseudomonadota bacterium]